MIPVNQLLARIRFDSDFGRGSFAIGYLDHQSEALVVVSFSEILFEASNRHLKVIDPDGNVITLPYHRIRRVWKDGELIWQRPPPGNKRKGDRGN